MLSLGNQNSQRSGCPECSKSPRAATLAVTLSPDRGWGEPELCSQKNGESGGRRTHPCGASEHRFRVCKALYQCKSLSKYTRSSVLLLKIANCSFRDFSLSVLFRSQVSFLCNRNTSAPKQHIHSQKTSYSLKSHTNSNGTYVKMG